MAKKNQQDTPKAYPKLLGAIGTPSGHNTGIDVILGQITKIQRPLPIIDNYTLHLTKRKAVLGQTAVSNKQNRTQMKTEFKEEQKFTQWWLWLILIPIGILPIFGIYKQLILGEQFGNKPMSDLGLIIFSVFVFSLIGLFLIMKLKTSIDKNGIQMNFFPFTKKRIEWNEIKNTKVVNYGFVGGWGIRLWTKYGTVYNMKGNKGLAIELKNGKKILIGTQKETELNNVVEKMPVANNV